MSHKSSAEQLMKRVREDEQLWSITAVTRQTGIGEHTLRSWERRFGFPDPLRLSSGHRRYTTEQVRHLSVIAQALRKGHRAGDVVPLPLEEIEALLRTSEHGHAAPQAPEAWIDRMLESARRFDRARIVDGLKWESTTLGLPRFMRERVEPLVIRVGEAWRAGSLDVAHEHFLSEILEDTLRALRTPLEVAAIGPPVLLTTLPGESHSLGLQMAGAAIALAGRSVRILGVQTPAAQVAAAARSANAVAVGISVSPATATEKTVAELGEVRELLPTPVRVWVGGGGAGLLSRVPDGVRLLRTLHELTSEVCVLPSDDVGS